MFQLTIQNEVQPGIFSAKGFFEAASGAKGDADVLVKKVDDKSVQLVLDARLKVSKMANREVLLYTNAKPEAVKAVKEGETFEVKNPIWFSLKKIN